MSETHTIELRRVLRAPPERIYRAFTTPEAMAKWLPPHGFVGQVHQMDVRVGGQWRMSFINLGTGGAHSFGGTYLELAPPGRIRYTSVFDDANLPGEMVTTVTLTPVFCGTELVATQAGIPAVIPAAACQLGWQESLLLLAQLVEAEIPG
ncbi:SRPBCC family protein [Aquabacterium sp. OR-4]|uniref:SRPBCC family protein n=1 Tax=Aquabacterium sp. OR-4 TaxID=2978127 RepID=UPI0021B1E219|nr:SRPBCC family protein [Aquabacterium sp. OR-4]MDT7838240.1 SRPBCC family protein [Aquabacterium sp. OR-4]